MTPSLNPALPRWASGTTAIVLVALSLLAGACRLDTASTRPPTPEATRPGPPPSTSETTATPSSDATATASPTPTSTPPPSPDTSQPEVDETEVDQPEVDQTEADQTEVDETEPEAQEPGDDVLRHGDEGEQVVAIQQRLADLGYWIGPIDGTFGDLTQQAVLAFQGWEQITRDGIVGPETRARLADATRPSPVNGGDLTEVHRDRGVLLVVRDGATHVALHVSTGSNEAYQHPAGHRAVADTPPGTWTVTWQYDGIRRADLGGLYRPKYFHEHGIAIHGFGQVPAWPASHGCVRVSKPAMDMLWTDGLVPVGSTVVVV